jgi:hypothetical protein
MRFLNSLIGCNVGVADERDILLCEPLRRTQVA